jgi:hypothetical protein
VAHAGQAGDAADDGVRRADHEHDEPRVAQPSCRPVRGESKVLVSKAPTGPVAPTHGAQPAGGDGDDAHREHRVRAPLDAQLGGRAADVESFLPKVAGPWT